MSASSEKEQKVKKDPLENQSDVSLTSTAADIENLISKEPTLHRPAAPVIVPDFLPGKVNAQLFPPRHFKFEKLEIGSWKVSCIIL